MTVSVPELQQQILELSFESFETFCEDISGMFGIDMSCSELYSSTGTISDLKKDFRKLIAVNTVNSEGLIDGEFKLIFDQKGLFTLSGTIVMLPEKRILENCKTGKLEDAKEMQDAVGETGNLLVGSWDRIFRENFDGHGHFVQNGSYIGDPWKNTQSEIGLPADQEILFSVFEMTIDEFAPFKCGVIFPLKTINQSVDSPSQPDESSDSSQKEDTQTSQAKEQKQPETEQTTQETDVQQQQEAKSEKQPENTNQETPAQGEEKISPDPPEQAETDLQPEQQDQQPHDADSQDQKGPVSESISKMTSSKPDLPGSPDSVAVNADLTAQQIMQKSVTWCSAEDTVQAVSNKMQSNNASYILVGSEQDLQGIISNSDLASAISPYLKPVFAKWRRPLDDASLNIKVKWIMSRPVKTLPPAAAVSTIMEKMIRHNCRCFPVADQNGKILGIVTTFDIFKSLSNDPEVQSFGNPAQSPPIT